MDDVEARRRFAFPPRDGAWEQIDLAMLDPEDADERAILILAEHPELAAAIEEGRPTVPGPSGPMSPQAHLAFHEIAQTQLWTGEPPETWATASRLLALGYERDEVLHMLMAAIANVVHDVMRRNEPPAPGAFAREFDGLPDAWERQRRQLARERAARSRRRAKHRRR
jgi:hypothetical protein